MYTLKVLVLASAAISPRLTASHPNSEVKRGRARAVLRWGTTREGRVLHFSAFALSFCFYLSFLLSFLAARPIFVPSLRPGKCARSAPAETPRHGAAAGGSATPSSGHMCVLCSVLPESVVFLRDRVFRGHIGHTVSRRSAAGRAPRGPLRGHILGPRQVILPGRSRSQWLQQHPPTRRPHHRTRGQDSASTCPCQCRSRHRNWN